jgi:hypothetical protein
MKVLVPLLVVGFITPSVQGQIIGQEKGSIGAAISAEQNRRNTRATCQVSITKLKMDEIDKQALSLDPRSLEPEIIKALDEAREKQIREIEAQIGELESKIPSLRRQKRGSTVRQIREQIAKLQENIPGIKDGTITVTPVVEPPFKPGDFGRLQSNGVVEVVQVVGKSELLATAWQDGDPQIIWIKGLSTEDVVDGSQIRLPKYSRVTGTRDYTSALGPRRVVVIEPFDLTPYYLEYRRRILASKEGTAKN